jgi:DNA-binding CsgD family transcriptional regulator
MAVRAVARPAEEQAAVDFLDAVPTAPAALVIEGDPGIGKTTLWLETLDRARDRGFVVLAARAARAESVLAYASLADLLSDVDEAVWADLPTPQQQSLDAALLRHPAHAGPSDARAVAAAFVAVLGRLATRSEGSVLLAIDDLQWIDVSSGNVVAFAARRLPRGVGLLCTTRSTDVAARVQLARPDAVVRMRLQPLTVDALHRVLKQRLGISVPRPMLLRIHKLAGGNPFYALELARQIDTTGSDFLQLPSSLNELVGARIERVGAHAQDVLLAAASVPDATIRLLAQATDETAERVLEVLGEAETHAVVVIHGNRVSFTHPLLAHGVYSHASPQRRRTMHRRLAQLVVEPELRARHLALSDATGEPQTIEALDTAAEIAHARGAPAAAAELLDLAINLGATDPSRRILCATHHFAASGPGRARQILEDVVATLPVGSVRAEALYQLALVRLHEDGFIDAADLLETGLPDPGADDTLRVRMLIMLSYALFNAAQPDRALDRVQQAVTEAESLAVPSLLSSALGMHETLGFLAGRGFEPATIERAVDLEDPSVAIPVAFRSSVQVALLRGWSGEFDHAREVLAAAGRRCVALGQESELVFVAFSQALMDLWRGDLQSVAVLGHETVERASQLGGDFPMFIGLTIRGAAAAYAGRVEHAVSDLDEAVAAAQRCGSMRMREIPVTMRGFVSNSLGEHQATLDVLEPLLAMTRAMPDATEIIAASYLPEAIEAFIGVGRLSEAEPLIDTLEGNGRRLDRAWMLATALRSRAMLHAARGDLEAATATAELAMTEHKRLPMPFEQARTQLLLGQLQRRQRQRDAGTTTLRKALQTFTELGTQLWAERAKTELARGVSGRKRGQGLTPSEHRVAELAVRDMSNREIAAALFISPKTVEVNLSRIYRKLNIRSRVELHRVWDPSTAAE